MFPLSPQGKAPMDSHRGLFLGNIRLCAFFPPNAPAQHSNLRLSKGKFLLPVLLLSDWTPGPDVVSGRQCPDHSSTALVVLFRPAFSPAADLPPRLLSSSLILCLKASFSLLTDSSSERWKAASSYLAAATAAENEGDRVWCAYESVAATCVPDCEDDE
jgi:hypothetical protein